MGILKKKLESCYLPVQAKLTGIQKSEFLISRLPSLNRKVIKIII